MTNNATDSFIKVLERTLATNPSALNRRNHEGNTLLHLAVLYCHEAGLVFLLENGANPCIRNHSTSAQHPDGKRPSDLCRNTDSTPLAQYYRELDKKFLNMLLKAEQAWENAHKPAAPALRPNM